MDVLTTKDRTGVGMFSDRGRGRAARRMLLSGVALAVLTGPGAMAQQADQQGAPQVEEIIVTGSRIARPGYDTLQPTSVVGSEFIDERGFTNVADALNQLPGFGTPVGTAGDQAGQNIGQNFVNLFNLGTQRTLTLVNGRRFIPGNAPSNFNGASPGLQVDLNSLPTSLIERVEVIAVGGAPIYGADAVAGTVNIILKDDFEGAEFDAQYGITEEGDAENYRARALLGSNFANNRGNATISLEYNKQNGLLYTDRPLPAKQQFFAPNPANTGANDGIPANILIENRRIPVVNQNGVPIRANTGSIGGRTGSNLIRIPDPNNPGQTVPAQFVNGRLAPFNPGTIYSTTVASGGDGLNLAEVTNLLAPTERYLANALGRYDLTDNVSAYVQFDYARTEGKELADQPIYNTTIFGGDSDAVVVTTDNPFLDPADRAILESQGITEFFLNRASVDLVGRSETEADNELYRIVGGFKGDFTVADREVTWDVYYQIGKTTGTTRDTQIPDERFFSAIDVARNAAGQVVCAGNVFPAPTPTGGATPDSQLSGCVPLNLFGNGVPSAEAIDYVAVTDVSRGELRQQVFEGTFTAPLFTLPGGDFSVAGGLTWRKEAGEFQPGPIQGLGLGRTIAVTGVEGDFTSKEAYAEAVLPIVGPDMEVPFVHNLQLEGAFRYVDNSLAGGDEAWTAGGRYAPTRDVQFRGNYTRSIRSPAIVELFLPTSPIFTTATDPCSSGNFNGGPNPATREANCRAALSAAGVDPAGFVSNIEFATVEGTSSGSTELQNERAKSWSVGGVLTPTFLPGFSASVDWVDIRIKDAIVDFDATSTLRACYDSSSFPTAAACSRFVRGGAGLDAGQILSIDTGYINAGYLEYSGLQAKVNYEFDFAALGMSEVGSLDLGFNLNYINKLVESSSGQKEDEDDDRGEVGSSKWTWQLNARYEFGPASLLWQTNYISSAKFNNDFTEETRDVLEVAETFVFNATATYEITDNITGRLVVNNVFDRDPPSGAITGGGVGTYDILGRRFFVGVNAKF